MSRGRSCARCREGIKWVTERLKRETGDKHPLAALTGQDARALEMFLHALDLYAISDGQGRRAALLGMHAAIFAMQRKCNGIAKAAIPWALDWPDEPRVWADIVAIEVDLARLEALDRECEATG